MLVFLLVLAKKKRLQKICNLLIFNVVPTGLEPVTP